MWATLGRALLLWLQNQPWFSERKQMGKSPGSKMPLPLGKLVLLSSMVASGSCTLIYYLIRKAFSRASYYQLALEQLHSYPEALAALGPPLLSISSTSPTSTASWTLPMPRWHLQKVFLKLKGGQQIPVFKLSWDTGDEGGQVIKTTLLSPSVASPPHRVPPGP
ncbi:cytochrome c oxidase assembly factor 1 homolog [Panthera tigris]|uniref:cytochrome c oxidase assembly factor 1 homolog n=1 Tax=Panthera tigris TaxID=9694 RepID=UPI001C6F971D|nr:cytochrome c oxidase assembly factor 1 homolog [Panthera tigris]